MKTDLFIAEFLYLLICVISIIIVYEFWRTKNGKLRVLMILLFSSIAWQNAFSGFYFYMIEVKKVIIVPFPLSRMLVLVPMAVAMILMLVYLVKTNRANIKARNKRNQKN